MPLKPEDRALVLEDSKELESLYNVAALQGDSIPPTNPEDEVDFHFVCFVKSHINGHIYELDGDRKGPVDKGVVLGPDEDILTARGLSVVREFIQRERDGNFSFSLMALVST
jgi:ubiquitin carboxyl-terminal hydrolase L3